MLLHFCEASCSLDQREDLSRLSTLKLTNPALPFKTLWRGMMEELQLPIAPVTYRTRSSNYGEGCEKRINDQNNPEQHAR